MVWEIRYEEARTTSRRRLTVLGSAGSADAQFRYRHGWYGGGGYPYYGYRRSGWNGGALAAGLIGGAILGGVVALRRLRPMLIRLILMVMDTARLRPGLLRRILPGTRLPARRLRSCAVLRLWATVVWRQSNPYRVYYAY